MNRSFKTEKKIKAMEAGGRKLSQILARLFEKATPGRNLLEIEKEAEKLIKKTGGRPSFKMVKGYDFCTCLNINEGVVHGIPYDYRLKTGDLLTIDIGLFYRGFHTDTSCTLRVQTKNEKGKRKSSREVDRFLKTGRKALKEAIKQAVSGNYVGHISLKIQEIIEGNGYGCIHGLTGHGVGKKLHEPPAIPCFLKGKIKETPKLKKGMTVAVEVIYCQGNYKIKTSKKDKWTITTADNKPAAVFEETIVVQEKPKVLTPLLITG